MFRSEEKGREAWLCIVQPIIAQGILVVPKNQEMMETREHLGSGKRQI